MEIFVGLVIAAMLVAGGVVFILRRGQPAKTAAPVPAKAAFSRRAAAYRFTAEPVTGLGQLVCPRWTTRRRHVGVVCAMRNGYCRVALVNRAGYEPKRVSYRIGSLRRVAAA